MVSTEYKEAMAEVLCILRLCDEQVIEKIPLDVIKNLKENAENIDVVEEKFESYHDDIFILDLKQETLALLAAIYRKYICTEEQRETFDKHLVSAEQILQDSVDFENVFKKKENDFKQDDLEQGLVVDADKDTVISRLINKIKKLFVKK